MDLTCKAQYTGIGQFVRCLDDTKASLCPFAAPLGSTYFCKSPHWAHLYKKQNIVTLRNISTQEKAEEVRMIS